MSDESRKSVCQSIRGKYPGLSPIIRCQYCGDLHEEVYECAAKKEIAKLTRERDELIWLLEEACRCLSGHMIGVNCHGPRLSDEWQARRDMALNKEKQT